MISVDEAKKIILASVEPVDTEQIPLAESHYRVVAEDVASQDDIPPFDNSSMDGYALYAAEVQDAHSASPVTLKVLEEVQAGDVSQKTLEKGTAVHIMTGAPIPDGADAVIEQELTSSRNGTVGIASPVIKGKNIRRKGEDVRAGQVVVRKGTRLSASHMGALASVGRASVVVFRKPKVAFLTSGNELVRVDSALGPGKIRNSNAYSMLGLLEEAQCSPVELGMTPDNEEVLTRKVNEGIHNDALITSGGVSVGKYDLMLKAMENASVERKFWKVNIKPGGPFAFGVFKRNGKAVPVFALPGNPVSTMVTFLQFVLPGLQKLMGMIPSSRLHVKARLEHDITKKDSKRHFVRGIVRNEAGALVVTTTGSQSSGVLTSMTAANCFIVLPEERKDPKVGEEVEVELL
ncbi:MAG: molybdopterin molybdotransferase MoeA [Ignavibacteriales bacterium]|nr:molybdopterin molybdotransferase MoeA [Ignavibacteriales bacterium]